MGSPPFPTLIAKTLDDLNYMRQRQYVEPVINSHKLQRFVVNLVVPAHYLTGHDHMASIMNPYLGGSRSNTSCVVTIYYFQVCFIQSAWLYSFR